MGCVTLLARIGQADLLDDATAEQAAFEAQRVHHTVAGRTERGRRDGIRDAQADAEIVLPVERAAVIVETAALNDLVAFRPRRQLGDGVRQHRHIVVHHPEPFGTELIRLLHACGEAARAAKILGLRRIHHAGLVAAAVDDGLAPPIGDLGLELLDHAAGLVGMLVVHHDDAPRGLFEGENRVEQRGQQVLALVGGDDHGEFGDCCAGRCRLRLVGLVGLFGLAGLGCLVRLACLVVGLRCVPLQNVPIRHRAYCPTTSRQARVVCRDAGQNRTEPTPHQSDESLRHGKTRRNVHVCAMCGILFELRFVRKQEMYGEFA